MKDLPREPDPISWTNRNLSWHCAMAIKDEEDAEVKASEFKNDEDEVDDEKALQGE